MADSTGTMTILNRDNRGRVKILFVAIDITSDGSDGYPVTAASLGLEKISWARYDGAREAGLNVDLAVFIVPDTAPTAANPLMGDFAVHTDSISVSGGGESGNDHGVVYLTIEGY